LVIKVRFEGPIKDVARSDSAEIKLEGTDMGQLIDALSVRFGSRFKEFLIDEETGEYKEGILILSEGRRVDLDTPLQDGQELVFIPAIAGG
jgi:molybdopterin converting factor small subunit